MNHGKKQLTKNFFSLTAVQFANYGMPLISVPIISRIIGPANFGIINFAAVFVAYFNLLISYSFDLTATRKIARDPDNEANRNKVFSEVFYTQCLLFCIASIAFSLLLYFVSQFKADRTIILYSYLICIGTLFTQNWLFQAMQDLSKVAVFNLVSKVFFTIAILLVVRHKNDYVWQPLVISVIQTLVAIGSFIWAIKVYNIKWIKLPVSRCFGVLWEERIVFLSLIVVNLYTTTNTFILGLFQSPEQIGYYTSGQRLILIAQSVLTLPLTQAFYPYIGKAFGESRKQGLQVAQKLIPIIIVFTGVAAVVMYIIGPFVIKFFYGAKFSAAIPVFQILAVIPLVVALSNVLGIQIMLNLNMDHLFLKITIYGAVISIILNLLMIKRWGYIGTTVNWLVTELFILISMYVILMRRGINPINARFFKPAVFKEYLAPIRRKLFVR